MKTFIFTILCLFLLMNSSLAQNSSCCKEPSAPVIMASFGDDKEFRDAHPTPLPFSLTDGKGKMITFKVSDSVDANGYEVKPENSSNKWIMIFHEWYGLNDYIKKEADEIAATLGDVNVLAIDLYDGKVASNNEEASKYVKDVQVTRAINIINGAKDYAGTDAVFGTLGWCFGGAWSNQAAIELGSKCTACVIYYGMPEQDTERLSKLKAPVLGIFAKQDQRITPEIAAKFEENLKNLNIPVDIKIYDAVHAFANPSNPKHNPEATKAAKEKTYAFLKNNLK